MEISVSKFGNFEIEDQQLLESLKRHDLNVESLKVSEFEKDKVFDLLLLSCDELEMFIEKFGLVPCFDKTILISYSNEKNLEFAHSVLKKWAPPLFLLGYNEQFFYEELGKLSYRLLTGKFSSITETNQVVEDKLLTSSHSINGIIQEAVEKIHTESKLNFVQDSVSLIVNEMLFNAFFNAPIDEKGEREFKDLNRKSEVVLTEDSGAKLTIYENDEYVEIHVQDKFGSLTKDALFNRINEEQVRENTGGAGIGLHLIYVNSHHLSVKLTPKEECEFISRIYKFKRFKQSQKCVRSFSFFMEGEDE